MARLLWVVLGVSGVAALQPSAPRSRLGVQTRLSDNEESWPSDSSDQTIIDFEAAAAAKKTTTQADASETKLKLLLAIAATARGETADLRAKAAVSEVVTDLEAVGAGQAYTLDDLGGRWSLAYSSTQLFRSSPFWMAGRATCTTPSQAAQYDWFCEMHRAATRVGTIGAVRQIISPFDRTLISEFETDVAAFPQTIGGAAPFTVTGAIVSSADIEDCTEGVLTLLMNDVAVKGSNVPGLRQVLDAGLKIDTRRVADVIKNAIDVPQPSFRTTFVDGDLRVSRDEDDNVFVYVLESKDPRPTAYDDAPYDLGIPKILTGLRDALFGN
ncbi:hypothetical protein M885DRAFT_587515 [Pelagophyceae sp. CCMP2097]|nr:hypothetical protein M885DRAFT_587515 [Pelagophyceae sp. CCMP2097]